MCWPEKCTARRGRSGVPRTFLRMRWCSRRRFVLRMVVGISNEMNRLFALRSLARLAADLLAFVLHAFAFVRLDGCVAVNLSRMRANQLLIDSFDEHFGIVRYCDFNFIGNWMNDLVRIAQVEHQGLALY